MAEIKLAAEARSEFGKGASRRLRRAGKVPAVIYGHGGDPVHISLPGHETLLALRQANALLDIAIDGAKSQLALPKQVQRDPIKGFIEHVDLVIVKRGEKVVVDVPVVTEGEAGPETVVVVDITSLSVHAEATHIPNEIVVSIEGLEAGTQVLVSDLKLPQGVTTDVDPETLVVNVTQQISQEALDAEIAESEEETGAGAEDEAPAGDEAAEGDAEAPAEGEDA
ncbi:50S ribosomal protein L25/general stress protein Ctc [Aestuariimicrobium soli]|uniref:50S ribosomal protein L25/general stress protein Ctc n=1 Tax=Aestuariimicrobium soli TaxID=2035834 RepID=UPI003EC1423C